jgi:hypothetical protein
MGARARVMNIVLHSEAYCVAIEAAQRRGTESLRLYLRAHKLFQEVVSKSPRHPPAFFRWARMLHLMATQPFFENHSRRLLVDGAVRRLRRVIDWDQSSVHAHIELMDSCMDYLFNKPRLSGVHRRHLTETEVLSENSSHLQMISASMVALSKGGVPLHIDALTRFIQRCSTVEAHDRLFTWLQVVWKSVPDFISPFLQRLAKLREISIFEACVISKDTIVFGVRNSADLTSLFIRGSWDLDSMSVKEILDYTPHLEKLVLDNCEKVDSLPTNLPTTLQELEMLHTGIGNVGLSNLAHHPLPALAKLRLSGAGDIVNDSGLDGVLASVAPSLKWLHLGACHDLKWSSAFNYLIRQPSSFGSLNLEKCSLSGCRDIASSSVQSLLSKSTNLKVLSLAGASQVDDATFALISKRCTSLVALDVSKTAISTESLFSIAQVCTGLTKLEAHSCVRVHPSTLASILLKCQSLKELDASYWLDAEDTSETLRTLVPSIKQAISARLGIQQHTLTNLNLCNMQHLDADVASAIIRDYGKSLEVLDVSNNILLDDSFLLAVSQTCTKLQKVFLTNLMLINDSAVVALTQSNAETLATLYLISCKNLSDGALAGLANCHSLSKLELYGLNKVTNVGIQRLLQRLLHLKYLGLRQCKLVTSEYIHQKLRHSCPNLKIALEGPKQLLLDLQL